MQLAFTIANIVKDCGCSRYLVNSRHDTLDAALVELEAVREGETPIRDGIGGQWGFSRELARIVVEVPAVTAVDGARRGWHVRTGRSEALCGAGRGYVTSHEPLSRIECPACLVELANPSPDRARTIAALDELVEDVCRG